MEELGAVIRNLLERSQMIQSERQFSNRQSKPKPLQAQEESERVSCVEQPPSFKLTQREEQVLSLLTKGHSNAEIGNELHLSPRTVEKYVSSLLRKTETSNRAELVRFALEHHLVD
jgi:DNA-binding NarL/FixJ family response regulator